MLKVAATTLTKEVLQALKPVITKKLAKLNHELTHKSSWYTGGRVLRMQQEVTALREELKMVNISLRLFNHIGDDNA